MVAVSREEILAVLDRPMTASEIAVFSQQNLGTVRHLLMTMKRRGYVVAIRDGNRFLYQRA